MAEMPRRTLGRTGLKVGLIGLGTEYLRQGRQTVIDTISEALDRGANYFDVLMPMPDYRDNMGAAFKGRRDQAVLTCHLGGIVSEGQWSSSREPAECEAYVEGWLRRLGTDHADILNITFCNHCLPCPMEIPIGDVMSAFRGLGWGLSYAPDVARALADKPGLCTGCGECMERCPFGVDVPAQMREAASAFAKFKG